MDAGSIGDRLSFLLDRLRERLWLKPLMICSLSVLAVFLAKIADSNAAIFASLPEVKAQSLDTLLSIMASSMLVIATFSVTSMVSAYASASSMATPRSFPVIVADDASQNALSTFVGAFIFSIVALVALQNNYFQKPGLFLLFSLTVLVFSIVIFTFVRWVDRIARLGRMGSTIAKVESATEKALLKNRLQPYLGGQPLATPLGEGIPVYPDDVGYILHIDMPRLQLWAEQHEVDVSVNTLPGKLVSPNRPLLYVHTPDDDLATQERSQLQAAFRIGRERIFNEDPRFGFVVLSEIACRALSPAVNDPGTAIMVNASLLRLLSRWAAQTRTETEPQYPRVAVAKIEVDDLFEDGFDAIARDGAGTVEVATRLQKVLSDLAQNGDEEMQRAAITTGRKALEYARHALVLEADLARVVAAANYTEAKQLGHA